MRKKEIIETAAPTTILVHGEVCERKQHRERKACANRGEVCVRVVGGVSSGSGGGSCCCLKDGFGERRFHEPRGHAVDAHPVRGRAPLAGQVPVWSE